MADTVDSRRVKEFTEKDQASLDAKLDTLAAMVKASKYTVFFTGAGVSTSAGVGDYRGPTGAWTLRKIKQLVARKNNGTASKSDLAELEKLQTEAANETKKSTTKVDMIDAQPSLSHMAQATLIRLGIAHYVVTSNLDGIYRKAGLKGHTQLCCLHGDVYIERCTNCGYDFERNYEVRQGDRIHVHDHKVGTCSKCGSKPPAHYTGDPGDREMQNSKWGGLLVGTKDKNVGTKDTHINFGECLDNIDWSDAEKHCSKADLCIVAGTSLSLRHITHFPFQAKKTVIVNLQATPDDDDCHLRIWATCDEVFGGLLERLNIEVDPVPVWRPADYVPLDKLPKWLDPYYVKAARRLEQMIAQREKEAQDRGELVARPTVQPNVVEEEKKEVAGLQDMRTRKDPCPSSVFVGNLHERKGDDHHWTFFISRSADVTKESCMLSDFVDKVVVDLHPTFDPPQVVIPGSSPILLKRSGWGTFAINATIHFKAEVTSRPPLQLTHNLQFAQALSTTEVAIPAARVPLPPASVQLKKTTTRVTTVTGKTFTESR